MSDAMLFPASWEDFLQEYSFKDKEQIYTNGSDLIPVFRVRQMMERYLVEKQVAEYWYQGYYKLLGELANYKWVSVKDRLPEEGEVVLVYNAKLDSMHIEYPLYLGEPKLHFDADVTHWQYLPEKPESEDDAK
jgi:hypothetical protein